MNEEACRYLPPSAISERRPFGRLFVCYNHRMTEVQKAKTEDAEGIYEVQRRTWLDTYPNESFNFSLEDIRQRIEGEHRELIPKKVERIRNAIANTNASEQFFVVKDAGKVIGYTAPALINDQRRIGAIYILPAYQGKGVGGKLLQKAIEWHGRDEDIFLHVASYNQNAIEFYKKYGFHFTREVEDDSALVKAGKAKAIPSIEMVLPARR
jgi:ribosomal protein S18 acetylase RimI-like enzyme